MKIEIRHLQLVAAITEEKSVTKAAAKLFLTQSALSHQLKEIEQRLGTPLFLRLNKKMVLTEAGNALLETSKRVLSDIRKTEVEIQKFASSSQGTIRLSTECYTCYHWLPPLLKQFQELHPNVEVEIVVDGTKDPISALTHGKLDLGIISCSEPNDNLDYSFLFEDEMVVVMSPNHKFVGRKFLKPADLEDEHLIVYWSLVDSMVYKHILKPANVRPRRVSRVQLTEAIIEMVKAEMGVGVLARWAVESYIESGAIRAVSLTKAGFKRQWYAATLKRNSIPTYIPAFIKLLEKSGKPKSLHSAA